MQNWADDGHGDCRAEDDRRDAVAVCGTLALPIRFRDFSREYWDGVFAHFLAEYAAGRTPNPDVLCNREIKFKHFLDAARELGADAIATGHYARIDRADWPLAPAARRRDRSKDQSYFLHQLGQAQLAATRFPLGELHKDDVRRIAPEAGLPTAAKKDSTGICFIGERDFREFLCAYLPAQAGEIRDPHGVRRRRASRRVLFHPGPARGPADRRRARAAMRRPWYVVGKDVERNVLYVDQGHDSPWLQSGTLAQRAGALDRRNPAGARVSPAPRRPAIVRPTKPAGAGAGRRQPAGALRRPQRAVTPGQSLVLYDGDVCLGGAVILSTDAPVAGQREQQGAMPHEREPSTIAFSPWRACCRRWRRSGGSPIPASPKPAPGDVALASVFRIDADTAEAVYGDAQSLRQGLRLLRDHLANKPATSALGKLALAVLHLERRFSQDGAMATTVGTGIAPCSGNG